MVFRYTGNCALCTYPLVVKFPEDYPDDWKWCCGCLVLAKNIIRYPSNYVDYMDIGYLFGRIYKKMTLVEGK